MSSTITTTVASASATPTGSASCRNIYEIPTQDASCAMPFGGNHTEIMSECCGDANVISYYDDCGIYCLAVGQSVGDLTSCLFREGAANDQVWCGGGVNATATATGGGDAPTSASARIVATGDADSDDNDDNGGNGSGNGNGNGGSSNNDDGSAGVVVRPGMSVAGLTVGALLVSAMAFGFQM